MGLTATSLIVRGLPDVYRRVYSRETWEAIWHEFEVMSGS
jgi:hypothetical protein